MLSTYLTWMTSFCLEKGISKQMWLEETRADLRLQLSYIIIIDFTWKMLFLINQWVLRCQMTSKMFAVSDLITLMFYNSLYNVNSSYSINQSTNQSFLLCFLAHFLQNIKIYFDILSHNLILLILSLLINDWSSVSYVWEVYWVSLRTSFHQYTRTSPSVGTEANVNVGTNNDHITLPGREQDTQLAD